MTLLAVRQWFIRESGRYDLIVDDTTWEDNGANAYINAAQRALDRMQHTTFGEGHNWQAAVVNQRHVVFGFCRAILRVFATKISDDSRTELTKETLAYVKSEHFAENAETGTPLYYAPGIFRLAPESEMAIGDIDVPANYLDYIGEAPQDFNGILFTPACDESYAIETWGYFYSPTLTLDTDVSWWTNNHPELLVMATQMTLEKFLRNSEGVKDWMLVIKDHLQGIDFDLVEEQISGVNQMEG